MGNSGCVQETYPIPYPYGEHLFGFTFSSSKTCTIMEVERRPNKEGSLLLFPESGKTK
jgi:hypothetical protein